MKITVQNSYMEKIDAISRRQFRLVALLMAAFLGYYFLMLLGAAYFSTVFSIRIWGNINIGMLFTVSQYFMAGVIAWIYVTSMQAIDAELNNINS
ncbi:hypothetical protein BTM36_19275 [Herbaspirillum sp. VT-16-41]|nr:hypothetical protein BTM36_19275 [Herbaspirillum sp. VT-16-41]